jgi:DNA-binding MarR family transcriptional regulator
VPRSSIRLDRTGSLFDGAPRRLEQVLMTRDETSGDGETAAAIGQLQPLTDDYVAVLVIAVANRLTRGASKYYRDNWNLGVVEWRIMICLGHESPRPIGEIAEAADLDQGAVSRSIKLLCERGLVRTVAGGGRVSLASLTKKGEALLQDLRVVGRRREERLMSTFTQDERQQLRSLLGRMLSQVDFMNADDEVEADRQTETVPTRTRRKSAGK